MLTACTSFRPLSAQYRSTRFFTSCQLRCFTCSITEIASFRQRGPPPVSKIPREKRQLPKELILHTFDHFALAKDRDRATQNRARLRAYHEGALVFSEAGKTCSTKHTQLTLAFSCEQVPLKRVLQLVLLAPNEDFSVRGNADQKVILAKPSKNWLGSPEQLCDGLTVVVFIDARAA